MRIDSIVRGVGSFSMGIMFLLFGFLRGRSVLTGPILPRRCDWDGAALERLGLRLGDCFGSVTAYPVGAFCGVGMDSVKGR